MVGVLRADPDGVTSGSRLANAIGALPRRSGTRTVFSMNQAAPLGRQPSSSAMPAELSAARQVNRARRHLGQADDTPTSSTSRQGSTVHFASA